MRLPKESVLFGKVKRKRFTKPGNKKQEALEGDINVRIFDHSDFEYFNWLEQNRFGYVINTNRSRDPQLMILHRANCCTISGYHGNAEKGTDGVRVAR